uniref:Uncharacterized protein n=1 Tax=Cucumis sativus TaxID=3659 RepID=A0A0A0KX69_CUCSA
MLTLHSVRSNKTFINTEWKGALPLTRMTIHITPKLHFSQCILRPLLKDPHIHILHIMLNHESIKIEIRLLKARNPIAIPDNLSFRLIIHCGLEVETEEKPSTPYGINTLH